jgi:hypothetical protein
VSEPKDNKPENDVGRLIRTNKGPDFDLAKQIAELIWTLEERKGNKWVVDETKEPFLVVKDGSGLQVDVRSKRFAEYLVYTYGLAKSDRITSPVVDRISGRASREATGIQTARFSFWDTQEQALYISLYNGKALKIDGKQLEEVPNGSRVMFLDDDGGSMLRPATFQKGLLQETLTNNLSLTDTLGASVQSQRHLAFLWMLSSVLPQYFPNKPLAIFSGDRGSGKTTAVLNFQQVVHGKRLGHIVQRSDESDFYIKLIRSAPICLLDQLDEFYPWLADILCGYATAGTWERRKYYGQLDSLVIKPQTSVAISTRNPSNFSRVDLVDRSVFFAFQRIPEGQFLDDGAFPIQIAALRPKLLGEFVLILHKLVADLKKWESRRSSYRMSRFANFCLAAAPSTGIKLEEIELALEEAEKSRQVITGSLDPLITLLELVLARTHEPSISGSAAEIIENHLVPELKMRGMKPPSAQQLGKSLSNEWKSQVGPLEVEKRDGSGGVHRYTISLRDKTNTH